MVRFERAERDGESQQVPRPVEGEPGVVRVDATWGSIQPMTPVDGVRTIGELELQEHLERGGTVVDARTPDEHRRGTIEGAGNIYHEDVVERWSELPREGAVALFCNGPQCSQSPDALRRLVDAGVPAVRLLYYRGGVHDWVTLGLPLVPGSSAGV